VSYTVIHKDDKPEELEKNLPMVEAGWEDYWDNPDGSPVLPECQFYMLGWYRAGNADAAAIKEMEEMYGFYERSIE
jgi:hypothetical protein